MACFHILFAVTVSSGTDGAHREGVAAVCGAGKRNDPVPASATGPHTPLQKGESAQLRFICKNANVTIM